jgi:hypothetical protein
MSHPWIHETIMNGVFFALPAFALLAWDALLKWGSVPHPKGVLHPAFWTAIFVSGLFICSILTAFLTTQIQTVAFMVVWPLLGIPAAIIGFFAALLTTKGDRWKLAFANLFLLILAFRSIVALN